MDNDVAIALITSLTSILSGVLTKLVVSVNQMRLEVAALRSALESTK